MAFLRLVWWVCRRRWVRRAVLWLVARLIRMFGWRRAMKLLFRERRHWRFAAMGAWRAAVRLLRWGRSAWLLIGWVRAHMPRRLGGGTSRSQLSSGSWRRLADAQLALHQRGARRAGLRPQLARRRDSIRRSILGAIGVDPDWRPARKGRGGVAGALGHAGHRIPGAGSE